MPKVYRTMQGREIDMEKLMRQNELMPAVGNVRVNARGDELGPGGKIIKSKEDVIQEYYEKPNKPKVEPVTPKENLEYSVQSVSVKTNKRGKDESNR